MEGIQERLASILTRSWWLLVLRALAAIAFGVLTWLQPAISLAALVLLFGAYAMVDGVLGVWMAIAGRRMNEYWWVLLLAGLVGIGVGLVAFIAPGVTALALLFYIALWAIATGILQILAAIRLRREIAGEWWLVLAGLASVAFGLILIARPAPGALALLWLIATYAVIFGVLLLLLAFKARSFIPAAKPS
jgi:uncharacterized membrane protein HdeD (DUF308 family)